MCPFSIGSPYMIIVLDSVDKPQPFPHLPLRQAYLPTPSHRAGYILQLPGNVTTLLRFWYTSPVKRFKQLG